MRTIQRLTRMALQHAQGLLYADLEGQILDTLDTLIYLVREPSGRRRVDSVSTVSEAGIVPRWRFQANQFVRVEGRV
ncbi:hypothetical protein [Sulfobacillus harzensis]|uniref:Uncharacterized protein n=1 Tax=Sulfobacillus harzensis TaxID=2729629 RepID=A0A7Y0Q613_9FIRM|nr:hypothetical protein [Sulfobacillus harzensis]NMP24889.1 hypothetical protein [Sulfobacillus harzensis]